MSIEGLFMVSKFPKITQKTKGQAMAEFALTIPVFLLLVFGIIELSRFFLVYSSVFTAVREATRYGSSVGDSARPNYQNCEMIAETAVRMGNFGGVQTDDVTVYFESEPGVWVADCDPDDDLEDRYQPVLGDRVVVEIDADYDSLLGVVPDLTVSAENGRTIMLGVNNQVAVVTTEKPEGEATPEPTEDTTTPEPTEDTSTPDPTEVTTTPEPTEETSTPEPTQDTSTPETPEIICVEPSIILERVDYINSDYIVKVTIKNESNESYKVVAFDNLSWDEKQGQTYRQLDYIMWGSNKFYDTNSLSPLVNVSVPTTSPLVINNQSSVPITFKFLQNSNNIGFEFFLTFYTLDNTCPTEQKKFEK